jgi:monooxygenase
MLVFINDFRVTGDPADFESAFARTSDYFEQQPGFIRHTLVRSADDGGRYVNVAQWSNRAAFDAALAQPQFREHAVALRALASSTPALFQEILTKVAS